MWDLLRRNRRYARLWGGETVSMFGDQVTALALPIIAIILLGAPAWQVGLLIAAGWVPYLFALLIGTLVDRVRSARQLLIMADLVRAVALASIPLAAVGDHLGVPQLIVVAAVVGTAGVVSQTAYTRFFVRLVAGDDVIRANSLASTSRSASGVAGPPMAGGLIQLLGAPVAMVVDCVSYLVSAATLGGLAVEEPAPRTERRAVLHEARDGLRTLIRDGWLAPTLCCTTIMNAASFAILAVLLIFATQVLRLSPSEVGLAQGLAALGALVGALTASRIADRVGVFRTVLLGCVLFSAPYLALGSLPAGLGAPISITGYAVCGFGISFGIMLYDILTNAMMITVMRDDMRGRIIGAFSSINYGIRPVAAVIGGFSAQLWGPRVTIMVAASCGLLALIPLLRSPLRRCRSLADVPAPDVITTPA